jgi:hypothetical protein
MPILVSDVISRAESMLDAEGSDRYRFDRDYQPGLAYAIEFIVSIINSAFADTKAPAEALKELVKVRIWQTSNYSRFSYNSADLSGEKLWTILSIHPEATTIQPRTIDPTVTGAQSKVRLDLSFKSSDYSAGRLTFEQWNINQKNIFMPGNVTLTNGFKQYAYLDFANYTSTTYSPAGDFEIEVRPSIFRDLIGVRYLKYPDMPTSTSDSIEFPELLTDMVVDKLVNFISFKQGDQTTAYMVTQADIRTIIATLTQ